MIFFFGMITGAVLAWMSIYPYFHRVALVESRHAFVPRPSFLMYPLPEHRENAAERSQRSTALLPRRSQSTSTTSVLSADAADGRAAGRSSSAAADVQAAGQPSGTAAADLRAALLHLRMSELLTHLKARRLLLRGEM